MKKQTEAELIEEYDLISLSKLSVHSRKEYLHNLSQMKRFLQERNKTLFQITALDLAAFLKSKRETCSETTLLRKFFALRKFLIFLRRKKIITPEELEFLEDIKPKARKGEEAHRALTTEEIQQCFKKISHPLFRFIFFLGLNFGLRREEYTKLRVDDIDLKLNRLRILGKGNKVRYIPILPNQKNRFERFLEYRKRDEITNEFLLYSKTGKTINRTIERYFTDMAKQSEVKFTSHDLRVTFATLLWKARGDIYVISKKLGHASVKTTMGYVKPTEKQINERYIETAQNVFSTS
jgi:site-specific recombinase XerD